MRDTMFRRRGGGGEEEEEEECGETKEENEYG